MSFRPLFIAAAILLVSACDRIPDVVLPSGPTDVGPSAALIDGAHGGNSHFFFLPPMVPQARFTGVFDPSLSPVVEICEWSGTACVLPLVSRLTNVKAHGSAEAGDDGEHYGVNWHTNGLNLDPAKTYRIRVLVAGTELGSADVDLVKKGADAKRVDASHQVALVEGRTLPIKFRIEQGAVWVVGSAGGSISAMDGRVQLNIPLGALEGDVGFTFTETSGPAQPGGFVVPTGVIEFGPDGLRFQQPVRLTLRYNEAELPAGLETNLRLHKLVAGSWVVVPGGSVDVNANTVTGVISGFSTYGIVTWNGAEPTFAGFGTAVVDGVLGANEWDPSASVSLTVNLPGGGTTQGQLYVMNDATNLYLAVAIQRPAADPTTVLQFSFDNDNDGFGGENGEDRLESDSWPTGAIFIDGWWEAGGSCPPGLSCAMTDGTQDGAGAFTNNGTVSVFEIVHPLNSADNSHDFSLSLGDIVGFSMSLSISDASNNFASTSFPDPFSILWAKILIVGGVDQQQPTIDTSPGVGNLAIGGGSEQILAQVVTAGVSGLLGEVRFPVACAAGALVVEIQGVASGEPDGVVQASQTVSAASLPSFFADPTGFRKIVFSSPASVTAGSKFAIVLKNVTGSCGLLQGPVGNPYVGGEAFFDSRPNAVGVWVLLGARHDLPFQTIVK